MYTIETIEDAFIIALGPLKVGYEKQDGDPAIYATVRTIKSYQDELDSEESLALAVRLFPAILVVYAGSVYAPHGDRKIEKMTYSVFVCDKSLRSEGEARRGGAGNPGTYAMLNGARDLLYGKQLSLQIGPLELIREGKVWKDKGISVYSAEYETDQALLYPAV